DAPHAGPRLVEEAAPPLSAPPLSARNG
ncbi:MAG: hypothetical protein QOI27_1044, partial [Gaiellaceae bacterium]|nr:hypothetical protein [Gaiellaceae bacterium]